MKASDHGKPMNKDECVFAFSGKKYAETHAISAYNSIGELSPTRAAKNGSRS